MGDTIEKVSVDKKNQVAVGAVGDLNEVQRIMLGLESGEITIGPDQGKFVVNDQGVRIGNTNSIVCIKNLGGKPVIATRDAGGGIIDREVYACIGDGNEVAAGVIEMAYRRGLVDKDPKAVVRQAVEIAAKLSVYCGGKIRTYVL